MKNGVKKKNKNLYFGKEHETAIIAYAKSDSLSERTKLYVELIEPCLSELVDKIVFTYKFTSLPNINSLKEECKIWLTTVLSKYNSSKGSKAFSYFSIITKNYFIAKTKKNANQSFKEIQYETLPKELESRYFSSGDDTIRDAKEFWENLSIEVGTWDEKYSKEHEKKVLDAIKILMDSVEDIEIFNKKAIYFFLREITGLSTKQIVVHLGKYRRKYKEFKEKWDDGEV